MMTSVPDPKLLTSSLSHILRYFEIFWDILFRIFKHCVGHFQTVARPGNHPAAARPCYDTPGSRVSGTSCLDLQAACHPKTERTNTQNRRKIIKQPSTTITNHPNVFFFPSFWLILYGNHNKLSLECLWDPGRSKCCSRGSIVKCIQSGTWCTTGRYWKTPDLSRNFG